MAWVLPRLSSMQHLLYARTLSLTLVQTAIRHSPRRQLARARHYTADAHARLPQTGINIYKGLCSYGRFRPESGIATMTQQQLDQVIDAYGQRYADILMYALVES